MSLGAIRLVTRHQHEVREIQVLVQGLVDGTKEIQTEKSESIDLSICIHDIYSLWLSMYPFISRLNQPSNCKSLPKAVTTGLNCFTAGL